MTLASMTGFARVTGVEPPYVWAWEVKTVNAKGLDLRLRLPSGFDAMDAFARRKLGQRLARGTCYANLSMQREAASKVVRINNAALAALVEAIKSVPSGLGIRSASIHGLLAVPGVVELVEEGDDEAALGRVGQAALEGLDRAISALIEMRNLEGQTLSAALYERLDTMIQLIGAADANPARAPEAIRSRLARSIATLVEASPMLDPDRLHQEAVLLAVKADVREELDRLKALVGAARDLIVAGGPIGRRLEFLAQELAREANTLCSKQNDFALTSIGLDLKTQVEQFREQVQNIE